MYISALKRQVGSWMIKREPVVGLTVTQAVLKHYEEQCYPASKQWS
jgi:hypothetical protein